jgi:hypothetical protein
MGWGETDSAWYAGRYVACIITPVDDDVYEVLVAWEVEETELLRENLPLCHSVDNKSHFILPKIEPRPNCLTYDNVLRDMWKTSDIIWRLVFW